MAAKPATSGKQRSASSRGGNASRGAKTTGRSNAKTTGRSNAKTTGRSNAKTTGRSNGKTTASAARKSQSTRSRPATGTRSSASANGQSRTIGAQTSRSSNRSNSLPGTIKDAASKAKGPAIAVGAAAAGLAGGIVLKGHRRRKTVLGIPMPRSLTGGLPDLDVKSVAKTVGQASKQFAKSTKSVSKDLQRAGDQAERIGKILD